MKPELCPLCGGTKTAGATTYTVDAGGGVLVVKDVPARVCEQCGEAWFDDATMKRLETLVEEARHQSVEVEVLRYKKAV
jgi:YgiT-type zinc finger domain-containing protein